MQLKLVGCKSRQLAINGRVVFRGDVFTVNDSDGEKLLAHNTKAQKIYEKVKQKKGDD